MTQIEIIAIGKVKDSLLMEKISYYTKRMSFVKLTFLKDSISEKDFLDKVQNKEYVIALSEEGKELSSVEFAKKIESFTKKSLPTITFVIGSANGFTKPITFASEIMSLSKMTFTHEMALLFLVEQVYRAKLILEGKNYHRE